MQYNYSALLNSCEASLSEKSSPYLLLKERHIQALWLEQKYFTLLHTSTGEPITVISPGIWNNEAGPDFKKAHLLINHKDVFGDVEIHLNDTGWHQHGHLQDPHYENVILHIALWRPTQQHPIFTSQRREIPRLYLEQFLSQPISQLISMIDLDLYPYKHFLGSGLCAKAIFDKLSVNDSASFFVSAAEWRLEKKIAWLQSKASSPHHIFLTGTVAALGYKYNQEMFLCLASQLPSLRATTENEYLAYSLKALGFFESKFSLLWEKSEHYMHLKNLAQQYHPPQYTPYLHQVRPFNHPVRRLVYLSKLLMDKKLETLQQELKATWERFWPSSALDQKWSSCREAFKAILPNYKDIYWNAHYLFESQETSNHIPLLGDNLREEILINTAFPLLFSEIHQRKNTQELAAFHSLYASFTSHPSSKKSYLTHRFFGDTPRGDLLKKAKPLQGALQLHRDFCIHHESSCIGCPFIEKYQQFYPLE